jgi:hypothetical protein
MCAGIAILRALPQPKLPVLSRAKQSRWLIRRRRKLFSQIVLKSIIEVLSPIVGRPQTRCPCCPELKVRAAASVLRATPAWAPDLRQEEGKKMTIAKGTKSVQ